ncbi:MAG: signal peptide peptidase SppA [Thermoanaerobaculia bacterium]
MRRLFFLLLLAVLLGTVVAGTGFLIARHSTDVSLVGHGKKVLTLTLDAPLADQATAPMLPFVGDDENVSLSLLYRGFLAARTDPSVTGVALEIRDANFGLAKAQELRRQISELNRAGKPVRCYLETAGEGGNGTLEYYLASACASIALAPAGEINLLGLFADSPFLRGGLDKLKIEPSFLTAGEFKSYGEIYTQARHSPAAKIALDALLDSFLGQIVDGIAADRKSDAATVRAWIDSAPISAADALEEHLVDEILYPDEFRAAIDKAEGDTPVPQQVPFLDYARSPVAQMTRGDSGSRVAVLFAQGAIVRGGGGSGPFGGETAIGSSDMATELHSLAEDDSVVAVVLRIDSPGGSALASDLILREVDRLREKKPVIVSMSDVAASGGYYIAAHATRIVAEPATITGSIGVVTGKLATGRFQEELLGVTHDPLQRGAHADLYSTLKPFDEQQTAILKKRIAEIYGRFLDHVATGRKLTREAVEAVAAGRVWTGADAMPRGLVDELGGLDRAIAIAREQAAIPAEKATGLIFLPKPQSFWELLASRGTPGLQAALTQALAAKLLGAEVAKQFGMIGGTRGFEGSGAGLPRAPLELELDAAWQSFAHGL